ncbi:fimbrial protein, partial [Yersinia pestis]
MLRPTKPLISSGISQSTTAVYCRRPYFLAGMTLLIGLFSTSAWSNCTRITAQNQISSSDGTAASWLGSRDDNN